jgi:hypothetical protein
MQKITYVSRICQIGDWRYYEQMIKAWRVGALTANDLRMTLGMNMKYLWNRTHKVHENIFRLASPRHFTWIFTVKYAPIGDISRHGAMQRARKGTRKKECESKNLKNSETHGAAVYNECCSRFAVSLQKECGA